MSPLLVKPRAGGGRVHHVTPKTARWTYVGFDLWKRKPGELATGTDGDRETCLVFISGRGSVRVGAEEYGILGGRSSPFEGRPWSVYVPPGTVWSVEATEDLVLAAIHDAAMKASELSQEAMGGLSFGGLLGQ